MEGYKYARDNKNAMVPQFNRRTASIAPSAEAEIEGPGASDPGLVQSLDEEGIIPRAIRELFS